MFHYWQSKMVSVIIMCNTNLKILHINTKIQTSFAISASVAKSQGLKAISSSLSLPFYHRSSMMMVSWWVSQSIMTCHQFHHSIMAHCRSTLAHWQKQQYHQKIFTKKYKTASSNIICYFPSGTSEQEHGKYLTIIDNISLEKLSRRVEIVSFLEYFLDIFWTQIKISSKNN